MSAGNNKYSQLHTYVGVNTEASQPKLAYENDRRILIPYFITICIESQLNEDLLLLSKSFNQPKVDSI